VPVLAYGEAAVARAEQLGLWAVPFATSLLDGALIAAPPAPDPALACDLLAVCRLVEEKGLDRLIAALPALRRPDGAPATAAIVGDGPLRPALEAQIADLGLRDRVTLRGYVAHGPGLMAMVRSARLLALPSRTEGVPATALEAMAMRVPVVATAVGGLPSLLAGGCGALVDGDGDEATVTAAFAQACQRLLLAPEAAAAMAASAFEQVKDLTLEAQVDRVVALLEAQPGGAPARR
jgi:glycosyltransferase involved in cell wall biosynthesis